MFSTSSVQPPQHDKLVMSRDLLLKHLDHTTVQVLWQTSLADVLFMLNLKSNSSAECLVSFKSSHSVEKLSDAALICGPDVWLVTV